MCVNRRKNEKKGYYGIWQSCRKQASYKLSDITFYGTQIAKKNQAWRTSKVKERRERKGKIVGNVNESCNGWIFSFAGNFYVHRNS